MKQTLILTLSGMMLFILSLSAVAHPSIHFHGEVPIFNDHPYAFHPYHDKPAESREWWSENDMDKLIGSFDAFPVSGTAVKFGVLATSGIRVVKNKVPGSLMKFRQKVLSNPATAAKYHQIVKAFQKLPVSQWNSAGVYTNKYTEVPGNVHRAKVGNDSNAVRVLYGIVDGVTEIYATFLRDDSTKKKVTNALKNRR